MKYYYGIKNSKNYFEGWYFKHISTPLNIAFIPSISIINSEEKKCFIQVITESFSHRFEFPYEFFKAKRKSLDISINNNTFSEKGLKLDLKDNKYHIIVDLSYSTFQTIKSDIMGPFKFFPFMECKHNVFSMKHYVNGKISLNGRNYYFDNGLAYLEGDYGRSFPEKYIWIQSNDFNSEASFFLSIATIPYLQFKFQGLICAFIYNNKEYRFATYNLSKVLNLQKDYIKIKKRNYILEVKIKNSSSLKLSAPNKGNMIRDIYESINGEIEVILSHKKKIIFQGIGSNCGVEIDNI